jgi:pimeloyl-ACP methyl ester carboxylesterase
MNPAPLAGPSPVPVVLLPGLDGTGLLFGPLLPCLPPTLRPVVVGYPPHTVLSVAQLAGYVRDRLPAGEPFVLYGESYSAAVAVAAARAGPAGLRGLVLAGASLRGRLPPPVGPLLRWLPDSWLGSAVPPRFALRRWLLGPDAPPELLEAFRAAARWVDPPVLAARVREYFASPGCDAGGWPAVPTLLIEPGRDRLRRGRRPTCGRPPHVEEAVIAGPHLVAQRAPREVAAALGHFAARLGG